ncbi:unnamed protein product [Phytophthora lilii]|uniref:Unnamed protein product n=1 Tax=Phytophthora lilii TaxID=2077276 RepID=A0A9W6WT31_9STRA|nr:unnamed protein product [Phytophthora lilii]
MALGIPTGFVRKLYRILDHESAAVIGWDAGGASFSVYDSAALDAQILPRYFRGRLSAFRQQLLDHGFARCDCEEDEKREQYRHPDFLKGHPGRLSKIERKPKRSAKSTRKSAASEVSAPTKAVLPTKPQDRISLKVTLTVPPAEGRKRALREGTDSQVAKRLKTTPQPPVKSNNPLFSDDPEPGAMSLAMFVEGTGLLPASSELPDPISYLTKVAEAGNRAAQNNGAPGVAVTDTATATTAPMFSDDMVKSALFFLVSSSCTGLEGNAAGIATNTPTSVPATTTATSALTAAPTVPTAITTSTTSFLASLLASSTTGGSTAPSFARRSNPLFSDQTTDGDEDSIWNILVSSSVDRVRNAIDGVQSPQERLRLILEEREKLEEQRKKVGAPAGPIVPKLPTTNVSHNTAVLKSSQPQKQQNPLFTSEPSSSVRVGAQREPAEDDLWKLLMSSSIDSFRRVTDMGL